MFIVANYYYVRRNKYAYPVETIEPELIIATGKMLLFGTTCPARSDRDMWQRTEISETRGKLCEVLVIWKQKLTCTQSRFPLFALASLELNTRRT